MHHGRHRGVCHGSPHYSVSYTMARAVVATHANSTVAYLLSGICNGMHYGMGHHEGPCCAP